MSSVLSWRRAAASALLLSLVFAAPSSDHEKNKKQDITAELDQILSGLGVNNPAGATAAQG
jgi:hypothetical protein